MIEIHTLIQNEIKKIDSINIEEIDRLALKEDYFSKNGILRNMYNKICENDFDSRETSRLLSKLSILRMKVIKIVGEL